MNRQDDQRQWVLAALDQYEGRLVRYAQRLVGDLERARDVVQHVFLRLCDETPDELGDRLAAWLYTVCRNRALDVLRASGREHTAPAADRSTSEPAGRESDPAVSAEQSELHHWLRRLMQRLPAAQREAIDLWAEGFSYAEIGQVLQRHEGHVRVLVHRGLKSIREHPQVRSLLAEEFDVVPPPRVRSRPQGASLASSEE